MIKKYYRRDSVVVFPPVEIDRFKPRGKPELRHGFVVAGRQTPYKRIDLAVQACTALKVPLVVIGDGPDHKRLEKMAGRSVTFLTSVNDKDIVQHFQSALGFIMPNMDDFGIVAVEAMASGTPVIAFNKGGSQDYITPRTGLFFEKQTVKSLTAALENAMTKSFNYEHIAEHSSQFSVPAFRANMKAAISDSLQQKEK